MRLGLEPGQPFKAHLLNQHVFSCESILLFSHNSDGFSIVYEWGPFHSQGKKKRQYSITTPAPRSQERSVNVRSAPGGEISRGEGPSEKTL